MQRRSLPKVFLYGRNLAITIAALGIVVSIGYQGAYNIAYAQEILRYLIQGFVVTLQAVAVVIPVGFILGFFFGWGRTSHSWLLRATGTAYVEFFRSLPPLVLIVFSSLLATLFLRNYFFVEDPHAIALWIGVLALAFHSGSYQAEIVRAGILSVPTGQLDAADSIGLTRLQSIFLIVLPQAFRVSLPAVGNEFASVIKDTSLISAIGGMELTFWGTLLFPDALGQDFNLVFIILTEVALLYFVLTFAVVRTVRAIENRFKVPGLEAAAL